MIHPYLAICHKFPVFSFYLPHCDLLLDFQIQNISLIVSKAGNRCTFLIEGNPNTPTCYLMLITNGSLGTATGPVSDASLCLPYTQTIPWCPLFSKHIVIHIAAALLHMVSPLPQFLLPYFTSIRLLLSFQALTWITLFPHLLFLSTFSRLQDPNLKMSSFYSITHVFLFFFLPQSLLFPSSRSILQHLPHFLYQIYDNAIYLLIFNMLHISFPYKLDNSNNF